MAAEHNTNRDLHFKVSFMYLVMFILEFFDIDEEIVEILPTEEITIKTGKKVNLFHDFNDMKLLTRSGKILLFEFKKYNVLTADLKQLYGYWSRLSCKYEQEIIPFLITISKKGSINFYKNKVLKFFPPIFRTKLHNQEKYLNMIRDKLNNNKHLTLKESAFLSIAPLFEVGCDEGELVEEICHYIKNKKEYINSKVYEGLIIGMYLNIIEYVDEDKQENLMEMIDLMSTLTGEFGKIRQEGKAEGMAEGILEGKAEGKAEGIAEGKVKGAREVIIPLLEVYSIEALSPIINKSISEIREILK